MDLQQRINAFDQLGQKISGWLATGDPDFDTLVETSKHHNGWFKPQMVRFAFDGWANLLTKEALNEWLSTYNMGQEDPKTIAIIMAGNIPLVGFHDLLSVLLCGHRALVKLSSNDNILLPFLIKSLVEIEPAFDDRVTFTEDRMKGFDAVIATGSNNTARYFEHYFGKYPNIIRKNRNGVAVLDGTETKQQLEDLAQDVFRYYGLGCRNVSKVYLPRDYNFDQFFGGMYSCKEVIEDAKYMNNYDYNKAVYLMSEIPLLDNEFMLLKEDNAYGSPISVVHYQFYSSLEEVQTQLKTDAKQVQCVVGALGWEHMLDFGEAQVPGLADYADGVDTVKFLMELA